MTDIKRAAFLIKGFIIGIVVSLQSLPANKKIHTNYLSVRATTREIERKIKLAAEKERA